MDRPALYLSNWSSHRTPGMHGPGRKLTIMAKPNATYGQWGEGRVTGLAPASSIVHLMDAALQERRDFPDEWPVPARPKMEAYRAAFVRQMIDLGAGQSFAPGRLGYRLLDRGGIENVSDGDTLCCVCAVDESRAGRCHRAWAAPYLLAAGWRVVLDGVEVVS